MIHVRPGDEICRGEQLGLKDVPGLSEQEEGPCGINVVDCWTEGYVSLLSQIRRFRGTCHLLNKE